MNKFKAVEKKDYVSSPLPQEEEQNYPNTLAQYRKYVVESSDQEESEDLREKKTLKAKNRKRERDEELIAEYDKREFKDKSMKRAILQHNAQKANNTKQGKSKREILEAKGGVCFEVDKRQFKGGQERPHERRKAKKRPQFTTA